MSSQKTGLRAEEVAATLGVAYSTVRNWEQGRTIPTLGIFQTQKLAQMYECSLDDLASAVTSPRPEGTGGCHWRKTT